MGAQEWRQQKLDSARTFDMTCMYEHQKQNV